MRSPWESRGKKIHKRGIDVTTYEFDAQRIIVEGCLRDDRFQDSHMITGEEFPRGVIHSMSIKLLVNCFTLMIENVAVDLPSVPRESCRDTADCLTPIEGLTITRGFTAKVKKIAGGSKGCTHLLELLQAMAPAAFQGVAAFQAQTLSGFDPDRAEAALKLLANTCHAWRDDGPLVERLNTMLNKNQKEKNPENR